MSVFALPFRPPPQFRRRPGGRPAREGVDIRRTGNDGPETIR
jgi:hypothetical protein